MRALDKPVLTSVDSLRRERRFSLWIIGLPLSYGEAWMISGSNDPAYPGVIGERGDIGDSEYLVVDS